MFDLSGKRALVTGASRGLGQYFARALAHAGADLIITSRNLKSLESFSNELKLLGREILPLELDVTDETSIFEMAKKAQNNYSNIDILVNNAGCNIRKSSLDVKWEDWDKILNTNLKGTFFVTQAILPSMIKRRYGRIINIGSVTSVHGSAFVTPYCASRGGIKQMTMSLADEWGSIGITVNCLAPGWFKTAQNACLYENDEWVSYLKDRIPLKRAGKPNDLDGAIVFLASKESEYMTGQTLLIDGGISTGATRAVV